MRNARAKCLFARVSQLKLWVGWAAKVLPCESGRCQKIAVDMATALQQRLLFSYGAAAAGAVITNASEGCSDDIARTPTVFDNRAPGALKI